MEKDHSVAKVLKNQYVPTAEFFSQIINSLQDYSIFTLDEDFNINSWSAGAVKIFGYETEEAVGEPFEIIFTEEDKKEGVPKQEIDTATKEGRAVDNRWHICKDGSVFYAYGLVFPLIGVDGKLLGYVKILRDLTDRRKSEEDIKNYIKELEELNIHKESILAILSHDLRSPLAAIIQTAEYLKSNIETIPPDEAKEMLELLHKESTDELSMLDYLLEWARIKYASDTFTPKTIELSKYVKKVFDTLKETASINTINLHQEIEENTNVFADGKMVLSVLQNIVSNAIKHSHKGGMITVTAKKTEGKMIVEIKDAGVGMSKDIQQKLFTPQMNALATERKENKGAGIGLLLVKGFLEKNGGEIWVESIEGEGSSFYFTLPLKKTTDKIVSGDTIAFDEGA
ncbi:PAS domain-containing sensor histidine kinase [Gelidibacter gilvus]|uniref:histidine kinase n=1 Tax=Gelidibacter gilvus TaxID=59602 RepID=A0A4Q0XE95_9FLAO|nr:PAS domain-containing sensor histidine kinase [Gelidibacter gilvus]RXJ45730.1 PAS domain-containing sensor histidine kinase [Gelidibacter gilvus]